MHVLLQGYDVVLYGDSITENWRGTSTGELWKWSNGTLDTRFVAWNMKAVFQEAFQDDYRTGVMAIAGAKPPDPRRAQCRQSPKEPQSAAVLPTGILATGFIQTDALAAHVQRLIACNSMPHVQAQGPLRLFQGLNRLAADG